MQAASYNPCMTPGIPLILFGLGLVVINSIMSAAARRRLLVTATIVGYKQFPNDATYTDITRGPNTNWLQVVEFTNPQTGQVLQMYSNPGMQNPEPIGTTLTVGFDPLKTDPVKNFVWVQGGSQVLRLFGWACVAGGIGIIVLSLFLHGLALALGITAIALLIFAVTYTAVWHSKRQ